MCFNEKNKKKEFRLNKKKAKKIYVTNNSIRNKV